MQKNYNAAYHDWSADCLPLRFVPTQTMVRSAGAAVAEVGGAVGGGEVKEALDDLAGAAANSMSVKANIGGFRTVGKRFLRSGVDKTLNR